ncbi:hypothetical protein FO519_007081 [Halicephalobus sp. NKZ332]|nr:hypothetical protein FO519_007081 [Halicephalobus sp. NKZ332]
MISSNSEDQEFWIEFDDMREFCGSNPNGHNQPSGSNTHNRPLSPRTIHIIETFSEIGAHPTNNECSSQTTKSPYSEATPSIYSQSISSPDSGYEIHEFSDDSNSNIPSPEYVPTRRQNNPRSAKRSAQIQIENPRKRGRPLKHDDGPTDVIQKRKYARNYREKQKSSQSFLEDTAIDLYLHITGKAPLNMKSMEFIKDIFEKRQKYQS